MTSNIFSLRGVKKVYQTESVLTWALQPVDLDIAEGEFVAIMGPSGSGKTTLLSILGLLEPPTSGRFKILGQDIAKCSDRVLSRIRSESIGFVFQSFNLIPTLSIIENVELPMLYRRLEHSRERAEVALARFGLQGRLMHMPSQLSGGQQQRAAIARAIAGEPELILLDEITGNLDTESAKTVMEIVKQINADGTAIVMVTHDRDCARYARRTLHIVDGVVHEVPATKLFCEDEAGAGLCTDTF